MREFINKNTKALVIIIIVFVVSITGITLAYNMNGISVAIASGDYDVVYSGTLALPSSKLQPIKDADLLATGNANNIMKLEFTVKGAATNPSNVPIIYDVSLTNLNLPKELKNPNLKWRLYKNETQISQGDFSPSFDIIKDNRMVLTNTQQDLPKNSATADSYKFYIWISSESCTATNITDCSLDTDLTPLMNQKFSGKIRIELTTGSKKTLERKTINEPLSDALFTLMDLDLVDSIKKDTPSFNTTSCTSGCGESTVGIYESEDDLGTSYYFRGDVTNNYVQFGKNTDGKNMYWRIVRINGDGTIRMIYDGTSAHRNGESSTDRSIGAGSYNATTNDNAYVGYMYGTPGTTTYEETHANLNSSTIKKTIEAWYKDNIAGTIYNEYVADAIYCNNRKLNSSSSGTGIGLINTGYEGYRLVYNVNPTPTLKCSRIEDRFTQSTEIGNGLLSTTYPIGLITADEVSMAGALGGGITDKKDNTSFYLYTGKTSWTMTPAGYYASGAYAYVDTINGYGRTGSINVANTTNTIRPVITLKADAIKSGNGTATNPFTVNYYEQIDDSGANAPAYVENLIPVMHNGTTWVVADTTSSESTYGWYDYDKQKWANAVLLTKEKRDSLTKDSNGNYTPGQVIGDSELDLDSQGKAEGVLAFYVWIPRYKYKVWNINKVANKSIYTYKADEIGIDIKFIGKNEEGSITCNYSYRNPSSTAGNPNETCTDSDGSGYYTHPAFKFGDDNVTGFWMGKFELSSDSQTTSYGGGNLDNLFPRILPNVVNWRYNTVSNYWKVIYNMQNTDNIYGLTTKRNLADSHMITNMEWGATAYLTHSKYGQCINNTCTEVSTNNSGESTYGASYTGRSSGSHVSTTYTELGTYTYDGKDTSTGEIMDDITLGTSASTTRNIYGVYDINGGAREYIMGNMSSTSGSYSYNAKSAGGNYEYEGFEKYITPYAYGANNGGQASYNRGRLGDATIETISWNDDFGALPFSSSYSWIMRGGQFNQSDSADSGIFNHDLSSGSSSKTVSTRAVLIGF